MTTARLSLTAGVAWATTMAATAQLHQIAFTVDDSDPQGNHATDCALAANAGALVTATNMKISLFDMAGVEEEAHWITDNGFPFSISDPAGHFFDPRAEYDTVNDRLWVLYSEDAKQSHPMATGPVAAIHLGVSKASTTPQTFGTSDWWYYTGPPGAPGNGGKAIDLMASGISGEQFTEIADFPSMSVDNKAVYLFPNDEVTLTSTYCAAVIVPLSHDGGTKSILAGDRPDDEDVVVLRLSGFDPPDNSIYHSAVQEPFDQFEPAQFVVTLTDIPWLPGRRTQLRLGAVFFDDVEEVWSYKFEDMDVTSTTTLDFHTTIGDGPATPASTFKPLARSSFFSSAVFAYVGNDEPRIFCAHHIKPDDNPSGGGNPVNQHVVQWYVIDPDLNDFLTTSWAPAVLTPRGSRSAPASTPTTRLSA